MKVVVRWRQNEVNKAAIVKKIASGEVTDILSYIKTFDLSEYVGLDEHEIKRRCQEKYGDRYFLVKKEKHKIAFAGVIIAIVTSILSLIGSMTSSDSKNIQKELEGIRQEISEMNNK